jgi:hypothetical protein
MEKSEIHMTVGPHPEDRRMKSIPLTRLTDLDR